ncbi:MAG: TonB-dependent receptor [Bacteroidetes bacterium]|nr:TonB-dependent receptor [Bacteroidota bacterium]
MAISVCLVTAAGYAQNSKPIPVREALKKITKVFGTRFVYDKAELDNKTTSYDLSRLKSQSLDEALKGVLYPEGLVFLYVKPNYYTIVPKDRVGKADDAAAVVSRSATTETQPLRSVSVSGHVMDVIAGQVTDRDGNGLSDVTIIARPDGETVSSGPNGNYRININPRIKQLEFSSIGYDNRVINIGDQNVINVILPVSIKGLETVVVVGYGTQKKATLTGSVSTITGRELTEVPAANLTQALAGRLSGLIAYNRSGQPGSDSATLLVRGLSTTGDNSPLIVVDGIPRASFARIDPNDVESVSILKDASSIAVYGARAANGVIMVTTKRGKSGKTVITYNVNVGMQKAVNLSHPSDSYTTALLWNEAWKNEGTFSPSLGGAKGFSDSAMNLIRTGANPDRFSNTNWYDAVVGGAAFQTQHTLSMNGGGTKTRYYVSAGYLNQDGLYPAANFKRYSLRANFDASIAEDLDFSLNMSGRVEDRKASYTSPMTAALQTSSLEPIQYSNGTYHYNVPWVGNAYLQGTGAAGYSNNTNNVLENSMSLTYRVPWVKGLSVKGLVAFDKTFTFAKLFGKPYIMYVLNDDNSYTPRTNLASASINESFVQNQSLKAEASVNYNRLFGDHAVKALLLYTQTQNSLDNLGAARNTFTSPVLDQINVGSTNGATNSGTAARNARKGIVGRAGYEYRGKFLFDFSFRYDGSDVFPPGQRFGFFPAFSGGWRISEEPFFKNSAPFVDNLKIRASWGKAGNDRVGQFQYLNTYTIPTTTGYPFGGTSATSGQILNPGVIPNANFTWEKAIMTNIGLEGSLWRGRLDFELDYFYKRTKDILVDRSFEVPSVVGGTLPSENVGIVDNKGFELTLGHQGSITKELRYFVKGNFTFNRSRVINYPEPASVPDALRKSGKQVSPDAVTGYLADALYQTADQVASGPTPLYPNTKPGDIRYVDVNGNKKIDAGDQVIISRGSTPGIIYGFNPGLSWKGFDMNVLFQGAADVRPYLGSLINNAFYAGGMQVYQYQEDRWTPDHTNASFPRMTITSKNNQIASSYWVRSSAYVRMKNIEIGYTFPHLILKKGSIGQLHLYLNGSNLFTISGIKNIVDPETGVNATAYPLVKVFNAGATISF